MVSKILLSEFNVLCLYDPVYAFPTRAEAAAEIVRLITEVGRCTLNPPNPWLKGAWYPGSFNPCT
jgi:hypothetical protein